MDQQKIGKFIADHRKEKKLTQEQLAEKLGITDRAISKWENGRGMPDLSLMKPLCKELGITINELLLDNNIELKQDISKGKAKSHKKRNTWEIILLTLGSPIWISLLIAILSIFFSIYIALWSIIICLWATFASVLGYACVGILTGIIFAFGNNNFTGLAMIGAGIVCIGLSILLFFGCKMATKGILLLTKKIVLLIKNCFLKKEVANG